MALTRSQRKHYLACVSKALSAWAAAMARAKAAKMTKRQRSEHARKMALARWAKKARAAVDADLAAIQRGGK